MASGRIILRTRRCRSSLTATLADRERGVPGAAFLPTTGGNSYKSAGSFTDAAFELILEREMLSKEGAAALFPVSRQSRRNVMGGGLA